MSSRGRWSFEADQHVDHRPQALPGGGSLLPPRAAASAARVSATMHTSLATIGQIAKKLYELHGLDAQALFSEQGITLDEIRNPNARIPSRTWDALARRTATLIADPAFGLRAAHCWHPSNLGALGYAWLSSSTLRTGLQRVVRYWPGCSARKRPHIWRTPTPA